MTTGDLAILFARHEDEFLEFELFEHAKVSERRDLCAFMLLDHLVPGKTDMVSAAEHDEIWLNVLPEGLAKALEDKDADTIIKDLVRCGVFFDEYSDGLRMFV